MHAAARRVVATYYAIAGLFTLSAALIWGVNTLFLLDAGLDILGVFIANAWFTAGMVLFEVPTGVVADTGGRRISFLLSAAILSISTLGYLVVARTGGGLVAFSVVSVVMGLGFTFYSGAIEAWLVDALKSTGFDKQLDQVFARGAMVTGAAGVQSVAAVGIGLTNSFWLALLLLALPAAGWGVAGPVKQRHTCTPAIPRASVRRWYRSTRYSAMPAGLRARSAWGGCNGLSP